MNSVDLTNYWIESSDRDYESMKRILKQNNIPGLCL